MQCDICLRLSLQMYVIWAVYWRFFRMKTDFHANSLPCGIVAHYEIGCYIFAHVHHYITPFWQWGNLLKSCCITYLKLTLPKAFIKQIWWDFKNLFTCSLKLSNLFMTEWDIKITKFSFTEVMRRVFRLPLLSVLNKCESLEVPSSSKVTKNPLFKFH